MPGQTEQDGPDPISSTAAVPLQGGELSESARTSKQPSIDPSGLEAQGWTRFVRPVLGLLGLVACAAILRRFGARALLDTLAGAKPAWLAVYVGWIALLFSGYALRTQFLLGALDERSVGFRRLFEVRLAGLAVGSLTPGAKLGGEPLRAWLLIRSGAAVGPAVGVTAVDRSLELLANLAFAIAYGVMFADRDPRTAARALGVIALAGTALVGILVVMVRRLRAGRSMVPNGLVRMVERLGGSSDSVHDVDAAVRRLLDTEAPLLVGCLVSALVLNAMVFAEYAILFRAFDVTPSLPELAGVLLGVGLAHALPVPASLGALEGAQVAIVHLAGGPPSLGLAAATVARVRDLFWTVPGALCLVRDGVWLRPDRS